MLHVAWCNVPATVHCTEHCCYDYSAKLQVEFTSADGFTSESVVTAVIKAAKPSSTGRSTGSIRAQPEVPTPHTVDVLSAELSTTAPVEVCRASKPQQSAHSGASVDALIESDRTHSR
jgi:hypothetical protein